MSAAPAHDEPDGSHRQQKDRDFGRQPTRLLANADAHMPIPTSCEHRRHYGQTRIEGTTEDVPYTELC